VSSLKANDELLAEATKVAKAKIPEDKWNTYVGIAARIGAQVAVEGGIVSMGVRTIDDVIQQCLDDSNEWFPGTSGDIPFLTLALFGEVGEAGNHIKKVMRETKTWKEVDEELREEFIDAFIYLMNIFGELSIDPIEEYKKKRAFNAKRFGTKLTVETVPTGEML
jgi:NTP pyrophosphatase (non-canonical NTP hydrolase)